MSFARPSAGRSIRTSQSLLERLRDCDNLEDWRQFFELYWQMIHATACKAGLTDTEAQVYLAKLRVGRLLQAEVKRLEAAELGCWPAIPNPA